MSKRTLGLTAALLLCAGAMTALPVAPARAADTANVKCHLKFSLSGWSILYKHAEGQGVVTCDNGQSAPVKISVVGGGLTAGKFRIDDVFGDYAQASAEAGVVKSGTAQVLTKGTTSLALAGTGQGVNLGVSVGKFTISRR
jgi:hypothetical protein